MSPFSAKASRLKAQMFPTMEFDRPPLLKLSKLDQEFPGFLQRIGTKTQNGRKLFSEDLDVYRCYYDSFYEDMSGYETWHSDDTGTGGGSCVYSETRDMSEPSSTWEVNAIEVSDIGGDDDNSSDVHLTTGETTELQTPAYLRPNAVSKTTEDEESRSDNGIAHTETTSESITESTANSFAVNATEVPEVQMGLQAGEERRLQNGDSSDKEQLRPPSKKGPTETNDKELRSTSSQSPSLLEETSLAAPDSFLPCNIPRDIFASTLPTTLVPEHGDTAHLECPIEDEVGGVRALVLETPEYGPAEKLTVDVLPGFRMAVASLCNSEERDETTALPLHVPPQTTRTTRWPPELPSRGMRRSTSVGRSEFTSDGAPSLLASTSASIYAQPLREPIPTDVSNHPAWYPSNRVQNDTAAEVNINPAGRWLLDMLACDKWKDAFDRWGGLHLANCSHFECQALHKLGTNPCSYLIPSCAAFRRGFMATQILHIEVCQGCNPELAEQHIPVPSCLGSTSAESALCDWNSHHSSDLESPRRSEDCSEIEPGVYSSPSKRMSDSDVESHPPSKSNSFRSSKAISKCNTPGPVQFPQAVLPHMTMTVPAERMSPLRTNPPEPYQLLAAPDPNRHGPVYDSTPHEQHSDPSYNVDPDDMPLLPTSSPRCTLSPYPGLPTSLPNTDRFDTVKNSLRRAIHNIASGTLFLSKPKAILVTVKRKGRGAYQRLVVKIGINQIANYETLSKEWTV